jgi:hypothetical protein
MDKVYDFLNYIVDNVYLSLCISVLSALFLFIFVKTSFFFNKLTKFGLVYIAIKKTVGETDTLHYYSANVGQEHVIGKKLVKIVEEGDDELEEELDDSDLDEEIRNELSELVEDESSLKMTDGSNFKKSFYGTNSYMPGLFGLYAAETVIRYLLDRVISE